MNCRYILGTSSKKSGQKCNEERYALKLIIVSKEIINLNTGRFLDVVPVPLQLQITDYRVLSVHVRAQYEIATTAISYRALKPFSTLKACVWTSMLKPY
jgi:hypothetical protein